MTTGSLTRKTKTNMPKYTRNIICPYCGWEDKDSWEVFDGEDGDGAETEVDCGNCEKTFSVILNVEFSYTSKKISCDSSKKDVEDDEEES